MKYHIVGNGESVEEILRGYDLSFDELKNENKHIRSWNFLIPGTKLKIPVLSESLIEDINEIEPFIEDYYPKIKIEQQNYKIINETGNNDIELESYNIVDNNEEVVENEISENTNELNIDNEPTSITNEQEIYNKINFTNEQNNIRNTTPIHYRYVYPNPYYYRPIIYVIRRK